jgi:hypothetical protein
MHRTVGIEKGAPQTLERRSCEEGFQLSTVVANVVGHTESEKYYVGFIVANGIAIDEQFLKSPIATNSKTQDLHIRGLRSTESGSPGPAGMLVQPCFQSPLKSLRAVYRVRFDEGVSHDREPRGAGRFREASLQVMPSLLVDRYSDAASIDSMRVLYARLQCPAPTGVGDTVV